MIAKDIFVYHLDNEMQKLFCLNQFNSFELYEVFKLITRVAFLICDERILIPASNYFESDLAFKIINELKELNEIGAISLISSSHNLNELLNKKTIQHGDNILLPDFHYKEFLGEQRELLPAKLIKRERSASSDIKLGWYNSINNSEIRNSLVKFLSDTIKLTKFDDILYDVPRQLGDRAYISDYILPLLPINKEKIENANNVLNTFITREYIASFLKEYNANCLKDLPFFNFNAILPTVANDDTTFISYRKFAIKLKTLNYKKRDALSFIKDCTAYELLEFKYSREWNNILESVMYYRPDLNTIKENKHMDNYSDVKIGIITALPKECAAMKMMLNNVKECFFDGNGSGHRFFLGNLMSANGKNHKIVLAQCGMGNNKAAIRATNMLEHFRSIESIIMTGIAGGIPSFQDDDKQVRLGDIVISNGVVQYDFTKETKEDIECRSDATKPNAKLLEAVEIMKTYEYENIYPWHEYIDMFSTNPIFLKPNVDTDKLYDIEDKLCEHPQDDTRTTYPKVFVGKIASANNLLKNMDKRNILKDTYGVLAVEMEASGIADATWSHSVGYLVIRGICDYCDSHKNDLWQNYASLVAAAYTRSLIESLPCL